MKMFATFDHMCSYAPTRYTLHVLLGCFLTFSLFVFCYMHAEFIESTLAPTAFLLNRPELRQNGQLITVESELAPGEVLLQPFCTSTRQRQRVAWAIGTIQGPT